MGRRCPIRRDFTGRAAYHKVAADKTDRDLSARACGKGRYWCVEVCPEFGLFSPLPHQQHLRTGRDQEVAVAVDADGIRFRDSKGVGIVEAAIGPERAL